MDMSEKVEILISVVFSNIKFNINTITHISGYSKKNNIKK